MRLGDFPIRYQHDCMQCGIACIQMICRFYKKNYSLEYLSQFCFVTTEGVSLLGIKEVAKKLGLSTVCGKFSVTQLSKIRRPCILHWNQNHFVVLHRISKNGKYFHIADPGKGLICYDRKEFESHWICFQTDGEKFGISMFLTPTKEFYRHSCEQTPEKRTFRFLFGYLRKYKKYFIQIILGLAVGCLLQLIMPFLTQWIVDIGISNKDIGLIWLILLGELMIVIGRTASDFIRRWLLLHISMRINISLVSDFFINCLSSLFAISSFLWRKHIATFVVHVRFLVNNISIN